MTENEAIAKIIESIETAQVACGNAIPDLDEDTIPMVDLDNFDSLIGVEVGELLGEFGLPIDPQNPNPFRLRDRRRYLTIRQVAKVLLERRGDLP